MLFAVNNMSKSLGVVAGPRFATVETREIVTRKSETSQHQMESSSTSNTRGTHQIILENIGSIVSFFKELGGIILLDVRVVNA